MNTVLQLARHILQFQPEKDAARLCFYHFLIHHCEPNESVDARLLDKFNRHVLQFEHWRTNKSKLVQEVQYALQHFAQSYQLRLGFQDMTLPDRWQVVCVENPVDCLKLLERHLPKNANSRLVSHTPSQFLHLQQHEDGSLSVTQLNNLFIINSQGLLEPLNTDISLHYDANLHLQYKRLQYVEVAPNILARFMILGDGMHGALLRGYVFQKVEEFQGGRVTDHSQVFYAIKRMEQRYVDRQSDPMYVELTRILEKAVELLNIRHPEALSFSKVALERGEQALENIFSDDNMVRLLTQTLRQAIVSHKNHIPSGPTLAGSWSENPNQLLVE